MYGIFTFIWLKLYAKCIGYVGKIFQSHSSHLGTIYKNEVGLRSAGSEKSTSFLSQTSKHPSTKGGSVWGGSPKTYESNTVHLVVVYEWNYLISRKKQMPIWQNGKLHNCPQCSVKTKDKNNTTTYKTTCKALFSKQNHRLVVLSFPFLVVTRDIVTCDCDPWLCAFFCFGREVCLDVLGQMINPCGFFHHWWQRSRRLSKGSWEIYQRFRNMSGVCIRCWKKNVSKTYFLKWWYWFAMV